MTLANSINHGPASLGVGSHDRTRASNRSTKQREEIQQLSEPPEMHYNEAAFNRNYKNFGVRDKFSKSSCTAASKSTRISYRGLTSTGYYQNQQGA